MFLLPIICFAQREADNWFFHNKLSLNFSSGVPVLSYTTSQMSSIARCASLSDSVGNLLFYANNDTIWGKNHTILLNGDDLMTLSASNYLSGYQGNIILNKPKSNYIFYCLNTGLYADQRLEYAVIDKNLNSGIGAVISKKNILLADDSLSEKLAVSKHCNNSDLWVVAVKKSLKSNYCYFYSYLLTEYGLNSQPVISKVKTNIVLPLLGQMKFNIKGDLLAWASKSGAELFYFNKSTGIFSSKETILYNFENSLGIEFSPNSELLYINRFQVNISTKSIIPIVDNILPTTKQLGYDGKIYSHIYASPTYTPMNYDGNYYFSSITLVNKLNLGRINSPNVIGLGCNLDTNYISNYSYQTGYQFGFSSLPEFPSYYFNNLKSDFKYSGSCPNTFIQFYNNQNNIDSLRWFFIDNGQTATGNLVQHQYNSPGNYEVECIAYYNNMSDTTKHCVNIAGQGNSNLPKQITICEGTDTIINGLQPFGFNYIWNTSDTTSALKINKQGNYILSYDTPCGIVKDTVRVDMIYCSIDYEIPNVFTPNEDGVNDKFSIMLKNTEKISCKFFNRWGNEILSKNENCNIFNAQKIELWNGLINEEKASSGTYYYVIELTPFKGEKIKLKGFFNLF